MSIQLFGVTGKKESGKTSFLEQLCAMLHNLDIEVGGFIQRKCRIEDGTPMEFELVRLRTRDRQTLARRQADGLLDFDDATFEIAREWLFADAADCRLLVIDEFGWLEAEGQGHYPAIRQVFEQHSERIVVASLRKNKLEAICDQLGFYPQAMVDLDEPDCAPADFIQTILAALDRQR